MKRGPRRSIDDLSQVGDGVYLYDRTTHSFVPIARVPVLAARVEARDIVRRGLRRYLSKDCMSRLHGLRPCPADVCVYDECQLC